MKRKSNYAKTVKRRATSAYPSSANPDKKIKISSSEKQFEFPEVKNVWQDKGKTQKILGTEYFTVDSVSPITGRPKQVEFELRDNEEVWGMGPNTRFKVRGQFQCMLPAKDGQPATDWTPCGKADLDKVVVAPNWFDACLKQIEMFHGNSKMNSSNEVRYVGAYLNAWKYNYMNKEQKKLLCPQACSPGYGVPNKLNGWTFDEGSEWVTDYGLKVFTGATIQFDYIPLDMAPFFQNSNYLENEQKILPMPLLDKITVRFLFHDDLSSIFFIKPDNPKRYRFYFQEISLVVEKLKLSIPTKNAILNKRGKLDYVGVTRILKTENINATDLIHKAKIQGMLLPEGMFIFALPKKVLNGSFTYQGSKGNVFSPHNIKQIEFKYGELNFFITRPNIGMFQEDVIESKLFNDYMTAAPFGLNMDPDKVLMESIDDGWSKTPYPHFFINFCNYGDKTRIVPFLNDGSMLKNENDMELNFTFDDGGAPADVTFILYYYYTDNNLTLDTSHKNQSFFKSPYLKLV